MTIRALFAATLLAVASPASALNILLTNDDGLTSNVVALYAALKAQGHDVVVSVPCSGQSGRGAAIVMYSTTVIVPDNDWPNASTGMLSEVVVAEAPKSFARLPCGTKRRLSANTSTW